MSLYSQDSKECQYLYKTKICYLMCLSSFAETCKKYHLLLIEALLPMKWATSDEANTFLKTNAGTWRVSSFTIMSQGKLPKAFAEASFYHLQCINIYIFKVSE